MHVLDGVVSHKIITCNDVRIGNVCNTLVIWLVDCGSPETSSSGQFVCVPCMCVLHGNFWCLFCGRLAHGAPLIDHYGNVRANILNICWLDFMDNKKTWECTFRYIFLRLATHYRLHTCSHWWLALRSAFVSENRVMASRGECSMFKSLFTIYVYCVCVRFSIVTFWPWNACARLIFVLYPNIASKIIINGLANGSVVRGHAKCARQKVG